MKMMPKRIPDQQLLLGRRLADVPYSAASDLREWPGISVGQVEANLNKLCLSGLVGREKLGWMRDAQWRYYLTDAGVNAIEEAIAEWQPPLTVGETGRTVIRSLGPMMECINHAVPRAWSPRTVRVPRLDARGGWYPDEEGPGYLSSLIQSSWPVSFHWLPEGLFHGLIELSDPDNDRFWVPVLWYGTHAPKMDLPDALFELFEDLPTEPDRVTGLPASPPGIVIVAVDALAATRAAREIPQGIPRAIVTYGTKVDHEDGKPGRFGIADIQRMLNPEPPRGKVLI